MTGATRTYEFRRRALKKLQTAIRENEDAISGALKADLNKHPFETYMCETGFVLDELHYHLKHLAGWMRERRVRTPLTQFPSSAFISPEPYGVVLIMSPWNYPLQLCLEPLIGAISGGNCAVVKLSAYAPNTSGVLCRILSDIYPSEYICVIEGGRQENAELFEQKFDYLFFTGSPEVGKAAMAAAAKNLTPVTLELGGKSPVIIDRTVDIALAARRVAFGKVINAGQTCVEPDYVLIEATARDEFIEQFGRALREFFPNGDMSEMARIINRKHYENKKDLLYGQKIALGGGVDDERMFIEPTVLIDVDPDSPVMHEEIFAPILPVLTWNSLDEAIRFVRSRPKPLALYLFTAERTVQERVLETCSFGGACINDTIVHLATPYMGFGGVGNSGMGQYHGKRSFDTFTHYRSIMRRGLKPDLKLRYFPYTQLKNKLLHRFMK